MQPQLTTHYGYCNCGCGEKAPLAPQKITRLGLKKGEPYRYIRNHQTRHPRPPYTGDGLCECGCGGQTSIAIATSIGRGDTAGHPRRFIQGHANTGRHLKQHYEVRDCGYVSSCWVWLLTKHASGYGNMGHTRAHRHYYEAANGPVAGGLELDHLCNVRACVNPDHLEPVTHAENMRRAAERRRTKEG